MPFADLSSDIRSSAPDLRGRLLANQDLSGLTWFRVGGPAQILFTPADEEDLAYLLSKLPEEIPVTMIGLGSNLIVRDGGIPGVVVRLGGKASARSRWRAATACGPARPYRTSRSPAPPPMPRSTGSPSIAAFPARSAGRCA